MYVISDIQKCILKCSYEEISAAKNVFWVVLKVFHFIAIHCQVWLMTYNGFFLSILIKFNLCRTYLCTSELSQYISLFFTTD